MQIWLKEKLIIKSQLKKEFKSIQIESACNEKKDLPKFLFTEHHQAHAAAAFYLAHLKKLQYYVLMGLENGQLLQYGLVKEIKLNHYGV